MGRRVLLPLFLLVGLGASCLAVESGYQPLTIVRAEEKMRDRVLAYLVDTPIYQQDPYFEVEVRIGDKVLVAERDPERKWEVLPVDWKPGTRVKGRVDKHHLYLQRPNGTDMQFLIVRRTKLPPEKQR
jgi:hypothetical protein